MTIKLHTTLSSIRHAHRTDRYTTRTLIVRRGDSFPLVASGTVWTVTLVRPRLYKTSTPFEYSLGYSFKLPGDSLRERWTISQAPGSDRVDIYIPPDAKVGLYTLSDGESTIMLVVLFNPFCAQDLVYLPDRESVEEHVMNDIGFIWRGTHNSITSTQWNYSQFRTVVLLSALHLLDPLSIQERSDPIAVSRHLSAVVNASDADNGVLVGNWSGEYANGVAPTAWTGSADILSRYWTTNTPVRYAQCWVFAGVLTSILRSLGIPATSVSNFSSAHESTRPYNRIVEHFYSANGKPQPNRHLGSIWNFHVWNHAWMKRPDLNKLAASRGLAYDGWQVVDATPQEQSMGLFRLGPAPLQAIKHGFEEPFDCDFVISEVNADVVHFWDDGTGRYHAVQSFPRSVGRAISIKTPGSNARMDITSWYKFPEGSVEERKTFENRPSEYSLVGLDKQLDVAFELSADTQVKIGAEIKLDINMRNQITQSRQVLVHARSVVVDYTGRELETLWQQIKNVKVDPGAFNSANFFIRPAEYLHTLAKGAQAVMFDAAAYIQESRQPWSNEHVVRLARDDMLSIRVPPRVTLGQSAQAEVIVTNHTDLILSGCKLRIEGTGLTTVQEEQLQTISANSTKSHSFRFTPSEIGERSLVITLDSNELDDVVANAIVTVLQPSTRPDLDATRWDGADDTNIDGVINTSTAASASTSEPSKSRRCCC